MPTWRHPFEAAAYAGVARSTFAHAELVPDAQDHMLARTLRPETAAACVVTGGSALLSIVVYAEVWALPIACGLVLGMWAHELGHRLVLRRLGLESAPIVFVPFIGAMQALLARPLRTRDAVWLALAGPGCALLFAAACMLGHAMTGSSELRFIGMAHAALALIDLLPLGALDGARAVAALTRPDARPIERRPEV